jgi:acyl-CoA synthetase (AMP-forming)/AMP-acid ligase II
MPSVNCRASPHSPAEESKLIPASVSTTERLLEPIERWERERPDELALRYLDCSWTWSEWAARIRQGANALIGEGLRPDDRVAFIDKNNAACLEVALAGVLAGTATVPVNHRLAASEVAWIVNDAKARVLFVGAELLPLLEPVRGDLETVEKVIVVGGAADEYETWLAAASAAPVAARGDVGDCFLQMYTSGTTGFPKGAMLTQRSLMAHTRAGVPTFGFDADSVAMVAMPLFHVSGFSWALQCIAVGGVTSVVRDVVPADILDALMRERVTHAFFVPAVYQSFLAVPSVAERDYSSLRCLGYGGSPIERPLLERCLQVFEGVDFFQIYGMTELSGAFCVLGPAEHRDRAHPERLRSAGRPMPGGELRILRPDGEPAAHGEIGEIAVRTATAMAGYWQQPEATAAALRDGWLHTGDAGRLDDDGYLYIEDRVKDMFISGGENVYPAEVERVIVELDPVLAAAVVGVPDEKWGEVGKAFVIARDGATVTADDVLEHCRERLAGYKRPRSAEVVDTLPRNATGKVLKHVLRAPYWQGRERSI